MKKEQISALFHLGGGMDCVTASYVGVACSSPTEKEQKFVPLSFIHIPHLYLKDSCVIQV